MTICPETGSHVPERVTRGPLMVQLDPPEASFNGVEVRLSRTQYALLFLLCKKGEATHQAIERVTVGQDSFPEVAKSHISNLRKRLPQGVKIANRHSWGYKLEIDDG